MTYKIISYFSASDLAKDVNKHLGNGWKLQGGVSVSVNYQQGTFHQAVAKSSKRKGLKTNA